MPETTAEQPWTPPVHDITADRADLPLYNRLYAATEELAKSRLQQRLQELTAESVAQDVTESLRALSIFLSQGPEAPAGTEGEGLEAIDPAAMHVLSSSLEAHLKKSSQQLRREDAAASRRVAEQMAAELARSLWSTLLDQAARHANAGLVAPERLLPALPDAGAASPLHSKLLEDLVHFSMPLEALIWLSHSAMERLAAADGASSFLQLPQRLRVNKADLRSFLEAQSQKRQKMQQQRRPAHVARGAKPHADQHPTLSTQQTLGW